MARFSIRKWAASRKQIKKSLLGILTLYYEAHMDYVLISFCALYQVETELWMWQRRETLKPLNEIWVVSHQNAKVCNWKTKVFKRASVSEKNLEATEIELSMCLLLFLSLLAYELIIGFTLPYWRLVTLAEKRKKGEANLLTIFSTNSFNPSQPFLVQRCGDPSFHAFQFEIQKIRMHKN